MLGSTQGDFEPLPVAGHQGTRARSWLSQVIGPGRSRSPGATPDRRRWPAIAGLIACAAILEPSTSAWAAGTTQRVSVGPGGAQANRESNNAAISANGRYVAFSSYAGNLVPDDINAFQGIFVHDRQIRRTKRVSVGQAGAQADGASDEPAISSGGRYVAFESWAANLVPGDTNGVVDVFVRAR
jgi:hypothetical protein